MASPTASTTLSATPTLTPSVPSSTVSKDKASVVKSEVGGNKRRIDIHGDDHRQAPLPFLPKPNTDPNLVTWDGPADPANPKNWPFGYRWWLTIICTAMTLNVTFASSAPATAMSIIAREFHVKSEVSYLILSLNVVGFVLGPTFWAPGSELIGRRLVFVWTSAISTIANIGQARANNMTTFLVMRFFCGFFAVAPLTNGAGVIADIWDPVNRGIATTVFTSAILFGPVFGPIVGSFLAISDLGWRWIFWVQMISTGLCALLCLLFLPETFTPVLLAQKAKHLRTADPVRNKHVYAESERVSWALNDILQRTIFRPFKMLLVEPILLLSTVYISLVYGLIYGMFEAIPVIFIRIRQFSLANDGLVFIGLGIGTALAGIVNLWFLRPYPRLLKQWYGYPPAEERLRSAMVGGPMLAIGIFWLGWSGNYESVPWWVPAMGTIPVGLGIALIVISFTSYLVDTYLTYSASAIAAQTIIRSLTGAAFPLFTTQLFVKLGVNWASTLLGTIAVLLSPMPFLFYKYGPRIRTRSLFAPCTDLKVAIFLQEEKEASAECVVSVARQTA